MRDLDLIEKELENKVMEYLGGYNSEEEYFSDDLEFDVTANGADFTATVSVYGYFSLKPFYEIDKYGISHFRWNECTLESFGFEIKDLWDSENGEYIVEDFKVMEGQWL